MPDLEEVVRLAHRDLGQVRRVKKCSNCECLLDVLEAVQGDLARFESPEAQAVRVSMQGWLEEGNKERHKCLGCENCLPIEPYNQFSRSLRDLEGGTIISAREEPEPTTLSGSESSPAAAPPPCDCGDT